MLLRIETCWSDFKCFNVKFYVSTLVGVIKYFYKMHGATIKIVNVQQAKLNNYKDTTLKLLKANATIWFNKI